MRSITEFDINYDANTDVFHVLLPHVKTAREHADFGIIWCHDSDGQLIGCAIIDFHEHWYPAHGHRLANDIARHLDVSRQDVERVLNRTA